MRRRAHHATCLASACHTPARVTRLHVVSCRHVSRVASVEGPTAEVLTLVSFGVFFLAFLVLRGYLFGKAVLRTISLRLLAPGGFPSHVPPVETDIVIVLWIVGWLLQCVADLIHMRHGPSRIPPRPPCTPTDVPACAMRARACARGGAGCTGYVS